MPILKGFVDKAFRKKNQKEGVRKRTLAVRYRSGGMYPDLLSG
jgi:hypothetical protein